MQLVFGPQDSIYKIFTTLDRLGPRQTLSLIIHHRNEIYQQQWRGKQIKALLESKKINYQRLCKHRQVQQYCENLGLNYEFRGKAWYEKIGTTLYDLFFTAKTFHLNLLQDAKYKMYTIFVFEGVLFVCILYGLRYLLLPSAYIQVKANYQFEDIVYNFRYVPVASFADYKRAHYLTIPYYTGTQKVSLDHSWRKPEQKNQTAKGIVSISNEMAISYTIRPGTRFVTDDNMVFKTNKRITIPAAGPSGPGIVENVLLQADLLDEKGKIVGGNANIISGTVLLIKNLKSSFFLKKVTARASVNFSGGDVIQEFFLTSGDLQSFQKDASESLYTQKKHLLSKYLNTTDSIPFKYNDLISADIEAYNTTQTVGQKVKFINGTVSASLGYKYILKKDLEQALITYLGQRPVQYYELVDINTKSLTFYDNVTIDYTGKTMIIPTKISIIKGYNFDTDSQKIKQTMVDQIVGLSHAQAQKKLTEYDAFGLATIQINPRRYNTLPSTKSRIYIDIVK